MEIIPYSETRKAIYARTDISEREKEAREELLMTEVADRLNLSLSEVMRLSDEELTRLQNEETSRRWKKIVANARMEGKIT